MARMVTVLRPNTPATGYCFRCKHVGCHLGHDTYQVTAADYVSVPWLAVQSTVSVADSAVINFAFSGRNMIHALKNHKIFQDGYKLSQKRGSK